jgi:hypothetical protein
MQAADWQAGILAQGSAFHMAGRQHGAIKIQRIPHTPMLVF